MSVFVSVMWVFSKCNASVWKWYVSVLDCHKIVRECYVSACEL